MNYDRCSLFVKHISATKPGCDDRTDDLKGGCVNLSERGRILVLNDPDRTVIIQGDQILSPLGVADLQAGKK